MKTDDLLARVRYGVLLGSQEWTAKLRKLLHGDGREQRALGAAARDAIGFEEIAGATAEEFGEPWDSLADRRGHPAKALAMVLCRRHTALKLGEIGERLGGMDYAAVSQACHRMEQRLRQEPGLAARAARIIERLRNVTG